MRIVFFDNNSVIRVCWVNDDYVLPSTTRVPTITFRKEYDYIKLGVRHSALLIDDEQYAHDKTCRCSSRLEYPELECVKKREGMKLYSHPSDMSPISVNEFSLDKWDGYHECGNKKVRDAGALHHVEVSSDSGIDLFFCSRNVSPVRSVARDVQIPAKYGRPRYAIFYGNLTPSIHVLMYNGDVISTTFDSPVKKVKDIFKTVDVIRAGNIPCPPEQFGLVRLIPTVTCAGVIYTARSNEFVEIESDMRCVGHSSMLCIERVMSNKSARN